MKSKLTISQMEYIVTLSKLLNYSRAAEELDISESTLSQQIKSAEDKLGVQLFVRKKRGIACEQVLTNYLPQMELLLNQYKSLVNKLTYKKRIKLGISITYLTSQLIENFEQSPEDFEYYIEELTSTEGIEKVASGELDMAIVINPPESIRYQRKFLYHDRVVLAAKPGIFTQKLSVKYLVDHLITFKPGFYLRDLFEYQTGINDPGKYEIDNFESSINLAKNGYGIALTTESFYQMNQEHLEVLKNDFLKNDKISIYLIYNKSFEEDAEKIRI
ncbi:LysR family transcriptional regulator [Lactobacillus sp. YT155]|uniref:LysR family transcriptional regulator n=1 Tax=Lactobacillus sp. YT155 TaxID=3060955 RepID=UPI00265ECF2A|nr:LysR family transcriptional regulator [Lactobacillus sp. YT155]MDO1604912.1 LysR family transcriptional regulator [Lactobacillus sp. YT155]